MYLLISYGTPYMVHGIFDNEDKATKIQLELRTNQYKNDYSRIFMIYNLNLNKIYISGAPYT